MLEIESTPAMAARVYATMARNLEVVRRRLARPLTLADKVLLGHLDDPERQALEPGRSYLALRPDRVVFQDVLGTERHAAVHADAGGTGSRSLPRSTATI